MMIESREYTIEEIRVYKKEYGHNKVIPAQMLFSLLRLYDEQNEQQDLKILTQSACLNCGYERDLSYCPKCNPKITKK